MTTRCLFITSSYLRTFLRMTKFCSSTFFCAPSICFERIPASMGWSSGTLKRAMMLWIRVPANRRTRSCVPEGEDGRSPGPPRRRGRARGAGELVVDRRGVVGLRGKHVEPADLAHALAELDVHAAAGHVRRDRDGAGLAGVLDDLRLALVLLGVQHVVRDASALEQL